MKEKTGIYQIKNILTGKVYVGSSIDIHDRILDHKQMLKKDKHHSPKLQNSVNKYGVTYTTMYNIVKKKSWLHV